MGKRGNGDQQGDSGKSREMTKRFIWAGVYRVLQKRQQTYSVISEEEVMTIRRLCEGSRGGIWSGKFYYSHNTCSDDIYGDSFKHKAF